MRPRSSFRSLVTVAALVAVVVSSSWWWTEHRAPTTARPRSRPAPRSVSVSVDEAVRRTLAAGTARLSLTIADSGGGPTVEVRGVASLLGPDAAVTASSPGVGEAEVRVRAGEAWLRTAPAAGGDWEAVDPAVLTMAGVARGWGDLLGGLRAAGPGGRRGSLAARSAGRDAQVWVDAAGRVTRLVVEEGTTTLDLRLRDHGLVVEVDPPP